MPEMFSYGSGGVEPLKPRYSSVSSNPPKWTEEQIREYEKSLSDEMLRRSARNFEEFTLKYLKENGMTFDDLFGK